MTKTHCNVCDDVILDTVPHLELLVTKARGDHTNCDQKEDIAVCGRCRKGNGPGGAVAVLEFIADVFDEVTDPEGT